MTDLSKYAFCEPVFAGPLAPWCIRPLTAAGKKFSGGVDTASLCGRVRPASERGGGGWDIEASVDAALFDRRGQGGWFACQKCVAKLRDMEGK